MLFDFCLGLRISLIFHFNCCCVTDRWHNVIVWWELVANNIQPTGLTIDKQTIENFFDKLWLFRTYPKWNCLHKLKIILLWSYVIYVLRVVTQACCIRSCISVIFQVRVVLTRAVVVVDWRFDNLSGGHPTWLWRLLPLRLLKRQSTTATTVKVFLKTTFTRKITLKQLMWLLGSNHSQLF